MSQTTINPYLEIGDYLETGLDTIVASLGATPEISTLVDAVAVYINSTFYASGASDQIVIEIKSVARHAINSYVNSLVLSGQALYNENQMTFIRMMTGNMITSNLRINGISSRLQDINDNLTNSGLTVGEQRPLLIAVVIGGTAAKYWTNKAYTPGAWADYMPSVSGEQTENLLYVPYWVEAAINGSLAGYASNPSGLIEPTTGIMTITMIQSLTAALTVTAGNLIFNWIPRIQHVI